MEGAEHVRIFDEEIAVNAEIRVLAGVSGHADKNGLIRWLGNFEPKPAQVFINHGDDESCVAFVRCLCEELGYVDVYKRQALTPRAELAHPGAGENRRANGFADLYRAV